MAANETERTGPPDEWLEKYERIEAAVAAGAVRCDVECGAREEPATPEEFKAAYEHWRRHANLHGCSHGR